MSNKNTLVTGGAGFIGGHLVEHLLRTNEKIRVLDNLENGDRLDLSSCLSNQNLEFIHHDPLNQHGLSNI